MPAPLEVKSMAKLLIKNVGVMVSGDLKRPIIEADSLLAEDGIIKMIGAAAELERLGADVTIDAAGTTLTPGLIDSHIHPVLGDFTPRQNTIGYIESYLHGGVTTMISNGEAHLAGRPKDPAGVKALAILAKKSFDAARPGGVKVHGGALILESGLKEKDIEEVAREGVRAVKFLSELRDPAEVRSMADWARKHGLKVLIHTGGSSIPGTASTSAQSIIEVWPDIAAHVNGGPTSISLDDVARLVRETPFIIDIVMCGNPRAAVEAAKMALAANALHRVIIGTDSPSGFGVIPLGVLFVINLIASFTEIRAEEAICLATGNTARAYGLNVGLIEGGRAADFVIMDAPSGGVARDALGAIKNGDIPGISMVIIDGKIAVRKSRNTPAPVRMARTL